MTEYWKNDDFTIIKEKYVPVKIVKYENIEKIDELLKDKPACVSFMTENCAKFTGKGSYVLLDFGKEMCGSLRIVCRDAEAPAADFRITFGESVSEACSSIGEKNATNDHTPRDFNIKVSMMSDAFYGLTGFRFARVELLSEKPALIKNIFAVSQLPLIEDEGYITTSDEELNKIIETAAYTLKLNFQNGYIWDGIKRDRLVWCGDLHQEILNSVYLYGKNKNVTNSLSFLRDETPDTDWVNGIPTYSAWWVINLCDYCALLNDKEYFAKNSDWAKIILERFDKCIAEDGTMDFSENAFMEFFLDWSTYETEEAVTGTAAVIIMAAKSFLKVEENETCRNIIRKLSPYLEKQSNTKQVRAFQILAGRDAEKENEFLEKNGAQGFSTFMAYYILTADALSGGKQMISMIKQYFGAMLSRGATTFWEDFDLNWLENTGRIDEFPKEGQKDIHGDFGAYCYKGFRHSLCHGWSSGLISFIVEYVIGLKVTDDGVEFNPHAEEVENINAVLFTKHGKVNVEIKNGKATYKYI